MADLTTRSESAARRRSGAKAGVARGALAASVLSLAAWAAVLPAQADAAELTGDPVRDREVFDALSRMPELSNPLFPVAESAGITKQADGSAGEAPALAQNNAASNGAAQGGDASLAAMAQKSNNPLSDVWLLITQNDTSLIQGSAVAGTQVVNNLKVQPVMPVPVFDGEWNLIFRPVLQFISSPFDALRPVPETGRTTGMGDTVLLALLGPNKNDGFIWGGGVTQIWPTATDHTLGQGKWQAGPAGLALLLGNESGGLGLKNWNIGALVQHWWSYASADSGRPSTNQTDIQYIINWRLNETQLIGMTPNIQIDWNAPSGQQVSFPIGIGTIGMFRLGKVPFRWGVEAQYYVISPDGIGSEFNFRVFIAPVIANPFK